MNPIARLLFDECLPHRGVAQLAEFVNPGLDESIVIKHLFDIAPPGTFDEDWTPLIRGQGWTVITADGGRSPNKRRGRKLPILCAEYGITLIVLSPVVHRRKVFDKMRTILSVWDQIVQIAVDPTTSGGRYMLEPLNMTNPGIGRIVEKTAKPGDSE